MPRVVWALISGEYPPQPGGVSDYTFRVAQGLAKLGDEVHVWSPPCDSATPVTSGVTVHRLRDCFGPRSLYELDRALRRLTPRLQIVVQYTPHAYGYKAMNVPFCLWLGSRWRKQYWVMFHEVAFPREHSQSLRHQLLATVTHVMASILTRNAAHVFISIQQWKPVLRRLVPMLPPCHWMPVPSNISDQPQQELVNRLRKQHLSHPDGCIVGHFGTYDQWNSDTLMQLVPPVLAESPHAIGLFVGRNSREFVTRLQQSAPAVQGRVFGTGGLPPAEAAEHLAACDLLIQPYVDGACTRRGTLMAGLALGLPIATTIGRLSDSIFLSSEAICAVSMDQIDRLPTIVSSLLADAAWRQRVGQAARQLYSQYCSIACVINQMRDRL